MKPPIEYRPKFKSPRTIKAAVREALTPKVLIPSRDGKTVYVVPAPDAYIVIRRDRANYNAYMRAYRAKKKSAKVL